MALTLFHCTELLYLLVIYWQFLPIYCVDIVKEDHGRVDDAMLTMLEAKIKQFEYQLSQSALELVEHENHGDQLIRHKRSMLQINDRFLQSYANRHESKGLKENNVLHLHGSEYFDGGIKNLSSVAEFKHLPVIDGDGKIETLIIVFGGNEIRFLLYNNTDNEVRKASVPLTVSDVTDMQNANLTYCTTVTKNADRLDLNRLLIVLAQTANKSVIHIFEIKKHIPKNIEKEAIFEDVSTIGLEYQYDHKVKYISASAGNILESSQYRVWLVALVQKQQKLFIDIYSVEYLNGNYRYSAHDSYNSHFDDVKSVEIYKVFQYVAIVEISTRRHIHITYYIEKHNLHYPQDLFFQTPKKDGKIQHVSYFSYGSRRFLLISTTGSRQHVKEIFIYGTKLAVKEFAILPVPFGEKWVVVNVAGYREEKLIYLLHIENGVKKIKIFRVLDEGLKLIGCQDTCPVFYLSPSRGTFDHYGPSAFYDVETAKTACLIDHTCEGVKEIDGKEKQYALGFLGFYPTNETYDNAFVKLSAEDGADLHCMMSESNPVLDTLTSFTVDGETYLFVELWSGEVHFAKIIIFMESLQRKEVVQHSKLALFLSNITNSVIGQETTLNGTTTILNDAALPMSDQIFVNLTVSNLTIISEGSTEFLNAWNIIWADSDMSVSDLQIDVSKLTELIDSIHEKLKLLLEKLDDVVFVDEDANITGSKLLEDIRLKIQHIDAIDLWIDKILDIDANTLLNETYRRDTQQLIEGKKEFDSTVTVRRDVILNTLNHLSVESDFLQTNLEQVIRGKTNITKPVYVNGYVNVTTVNGIDIGEEAVPLDSNKTIVGEKVFTKWLNASTVNVLEHGLVDNVPVRKTVNNVLTVDGSEKVKGNLTFVNTLTVLKDVEFQDGRSLSGVDVSELYNKTALVTDTTIFTGDKVFSDEVHVYNEIILSGYLNGLNTNDLFTKLISHYITAYKHFYYLIVNEMHVDGYVSGYDLPSDVVTLTTNQTIEGKHYFLGGITVLGNIKVNGTVDGVDISEFKDEAVIVGNQTVIQGDITFESKVTITRNLSVDGTSNEFDVSEVYDDAVFNFEENVTIAATKNFTSSLNCSGKFTVDKLVNGLNLPNDFFDLHNDQFISGHKTFVYVRFENDLNLSGLIDGVNITEVFGNAFRLSIEQNVLSSLSFTGGVHLSGDLTLTENNTVDTVDVSDDFVFRDGVDQTISGYKVFSSCIINSCQIFIELVCDVIDGVDVSVLFSRRVTLLSYQDIHVPWIIGDDTIINETVVNGTLNNVNMTFFCDDIMSLTKDQWILGKKYFNGQQTFDGNIKSVNGVNGFRLNEINKDAVYIFNKTIVSGSFTFDHEFWVHGDIHVSELIDGTNLTEIDKYSVRKSSSKQRIGNKTFLNGFFVYGDIEADLIGGFFVPNDTLTTKTDQVVTANTYKFNKTVKVANRVDNENYIVVCSQTSVQLNQNNCVSFDLSDAINYVARIDRDNVINTHLIFDVALVIRRGIILTGVIEGIDLSVLSSIIVHRNDTNGGMDSLTISSNSTVIINGNIISELFNGVNFGEFFDKTLKLNIDEVVFSDKQFVGHVQVNGKLKADILTVNRLVDGFNISDANTNAVFLGRNEIIYGKLTFGQDVNVIKDLDSIRKLNDIDINEGVVNTVNPQQITGHKTLVSAFTTKRVDVSGLVNGYYLPALYRDTLKSNDDQYVFGLKFISSADFTSLRCETVDGINTDEYVTLNSDQVLSGTLTFTDQTHVAYLYVKGFINGVNITMLYEDALFKNRNTSISSMMKFNNVIFNVDVIIIDEETLLELSLLQDMLFDLTILLNSSLTKFETEGPKLCHTLKRVYEWLKNSSSFIDYRDHPWITTNVALPQMSHMVAFENSKILGIKEKLQCDANDAFVFDSKDIHLLNEHATGSWNPNIAVGRIIQVLEDYGYILFLKTIDSACPFSTYMSPFLVDTASNKMHVFSSISGLPPSHASLLTTDSYVFVGFVFGQLNIKFDKMSVSDFTSIVRSRTVRTTIFNSTATFQVRKPSTNGGGKEDKSKFSNLIQRVLLNVSSVKFPTQIGLDKASSSAFGEDVLRNIFNLSGANLKSLNSNRIVKSNLPSNFDVLPISRSGSSVRVSSSRKSQPQNRLENLENLPTTGFVTDARIFRFDKFDLNNAVEIDTMSAQAFSTAGHVINERGQIYFIQLQVTSIFDIVSVSRVLMMNIELVNVYTATGIENLQPIVIKDDTYFASFSTSKIQDYRVCKSCTFPQNPNFSLYKFDSSATSGKPSLIPIQYLTITFNTFKVYSTNLGGVTVSTILFILDKSIQIYEFHGVNCYEKTGIIDLNPRLAPKEVIKVCTVTKDLVPAILLQTSSGRLFHYSAITNGFPIKYRELQCNN